MLEHVDGRAESLRSIAAKLAPGGKILITVPAYQWMWSAHDLAHHHKLRYSKKGAPPRRRGGRAEGPQDRLSSTACSFRSPPRSASSASSLGKSSSDDKLPPGPLNAMFEKIFGLERHLIGRVPFPAGVSLFALLSTR